MQFTKKQQQINKQDFDLIGKLFMKISKLKLVIYKIKTSSSPLELEKCCYKRDQKTRRFWRKEIKRQVYFDKTCPTSETIRQNRHNFQSIL